MTVIHILPQRYEDSRGWFSETWQRERFRDFGIGADFCQDNQSLSRDAGTVRGLHFQRPPHAQSKLVRCLKGRIFDVAVDIRRASPTFGKWIGVELSAERGNQLFIPKGYAHAFLTLEDNCEVAYKVDSGYAPTADGGIVWNDRDISIDWPLAGLDPELSDKDRALPRLAEAEFDFPYDGHPLLALKD